MKYIKAKNRRKYSVIKWLAMHIAWFTFHDTSSNHERVQ
jgi:hypothetical protein